MLGRSHAASGVLAGLVTSHVMGAGPARTIVIVATTTGAALLPDIDHPGSTVSNSLGPVTGCVSWLARTLGGGHRAGTHSLLGIAALAGTFYGAGCIGQVGQAIQVVILSLVYASATRIYGARGGWDEWLCVPVAAALVLLAPGYLTAVPLSLAVGAATHVLGDMLTPSGCPLGWPLDKTRYRLNLFTTGTRPETNVVVPLVWIAVAGTCVLRVWPIIST